MADKQTQLERAARLEDLWLEHMENLLIAGTITSTDLATLARVLMANGWTLDKSRLPQGLKDKLTAGVSPDDFDDSDVIPLRKQG